MSLAATASFLEVNPATVNRLINPKPQLVLTHIDRAIQSFGAGAVTDGYAAAREAGGRLRFGFVLDGFSRTLQETTSFSVWWWENGSFALGLVRANEMVLGSALEALKVFGAVRGPPYFVVGVQTDSGWLQRVFFHQVFIDENHLIFTESDIESRIVMQIVDVGCVVLKPMRKPDLHRALVHLGLVTASSQEWLYRPDVVAVQQNDRRKRLHIREIRGFTRGKILNYDQLMIRKDPYFRQICSAVPGWTYKEIDGTDFSGTIRVVGPGDWPGVVLVYDCPSLG